MFGTIYRAGHGHVRSLKEAKHLGAFQSREEKPKSQHILQLKAASLQKLRFTFAKHNPVPQRILGNLILAQSVMKK